MEYFPAPLEALVEQFARLPGIGGKTAQRLAFHVLSLPEEDAQAFADAIVTAKRTVTYCPVCRNFTAGGLCPICSSPKRDNSVICVVADPRDVAAMERGREFNGKYHVLHGVISPMNRVGPDDIAIKPLLERVAHFLRDQQQARQELFALSAEVRLSAWVLSLLPLLVGGAIIITNADYFMQLWNDTGGRQLLYAAAGLQVVGVCMLYRLAQLE